MMSPRPPFTALFEQSVPRPFIEESLRLLFRAYQMADDECRAMPWEVAHDYRGQRRRALIEQHWPPIALRYQDRGVNADYRPNSTRSSYFTQVICGRVRLTQSYVETPETCVRRAEFRDTFARVNTPSLFGDDPPPSPDAPLYAILIHGEDRRHRHPYFADIVFPAPEGGPYLARIPLFALCRPLIDTLIGPAAQEEIIPDEATPHLRSMDNREA